MKNNTMYPPQYETVIRFGTRVEQLCMWINRRATRQAGGDGGKDVSLLRPALKERRVT